MHRTLLRMSSFNEVMKVKKLTDLATMPTRGSANAAGFDLSSAYDYVIPARGKALVKTDIAIAIPEGTYARVGKCDLASIYYICDFCPYCCFYTPQYLIITSLFTAPRSGLAHKNFIDVGAGVIDYDYRGNVGVILFNLGTEEFKVSKGDRVAQLVLERISMAAAVEVDDLDATDRGAGGFGSTGVSGAPTEAAAAAGGCESGSGSGSGGDAKRCKVDTAAN